MQVPIVLYKGQNQVAMRMIEIAKQNMLPVKIDPFLARNLYELLNNQRRATHKF